jgi:hypothetical protein
VQPAQPEPRAAGRAINPLAWRLPAIETWPALVSVVQTIPGRLALFALFAALMKLYARGLWIDAGWMWLAWTVAAVAVALAGRFRQLAMASCTAGLLLLVPGWFGSHAVNAAIRIENLAADIHTGTFRAATLLAVAALAVAAILLVRRFRDHPFGRRPVLTLHILLVGLLVLASARLLQGLPQVLLWSMTATFAAYFWFLGYALLEQRRAQPAPLKFQLATFNPFMWNTSIPMGKGASNWLGVEARDAQELAVTQLKALKLLVWALALKVVLAAYGWALYRKLGVPELNDAFEKFLHGGAVPMPWGLASIIVYFPEQLLIMAVWGHGIIAVARLAGFRLLRNSYRPLSSRSIAEFWNRYFYYFKEAMVHLYFYPAYLSWFKRHPRLRIAFATFMAAGFGNFFFHFIADSGGIARYGLLEALIRWQAYAFYCLLLASAIVVSQLRAHRPDPAAGWLRGRFLPSLGVAAFYCFLSFFDGPHRHVALSHHFAFLLQVFGLG